MGKIKVADYLIREINKLGVKDIFGIPGDYNFNILYAIDDNKNTNWVGCTNELNAGYAADGYARINGFGALVTTYGVGELSAINAVAGSYAENIPVIHIVGIPKTQMIKKNALIHHNFQIPDYHAFERAYSNCVETTAYLNENNAKEEIDRILSVMIETKRPVYVAVPIDTCLVEIEDTPPQLDVMETDEGILKKAVEHAVSLLEKAKHPMILGDVLIKRYDARKEFTKLLEKSKLPVSNLLMGKGLIDADNPMYLGTFLSKYENINAYDSLENSDGVISVGVINSDLNTYRGGMPLLPADFIDIRGTYTKVEHIKYENILMKDMLSALADAIPEFNIKLPEKKPSFAQTAPADDSKLEATYIYPRIQEFLKPNDMIFVDTGIIPHGFAPTRLPKNAEFNSQTLWGSIGWGTAALLGGQMASPERRAILITGEGSHQLTACEVSTMMRNKIKPIIFVINNSGYTIERTLSDDPWDFFNDIAKWDYSKLPTVFDGEVWVKQAKTKKEFDEALKEAEIQQQSKLCYLELFTDALDVPRLTSKIVLSIKGHPMRKKNEKKESK